MKQYTYFLNIKTQQKLKLKTTRIPSYNQGAEPQSSGWNKVNNISNSLNIQSIHTFISHWKAIIFYSSSEHLYHYHSWAEDSFKVKCIMHREQPFFYLAEKKGNPHIQNRLPPGRQAYEF